MNDFKVKQQLYSPSCDELFTIVAVVGDAIGYTCEHLYGDVKWATVQHLERSLDIGALTRVQ